MNVVDKRCGDAAPVAGDFVQPDLVKASRPVPQVMSYADFKALPHPDAASIGIAYGADALQHIELWKPERGGMFPVVVLIHGGCWQTAMARADVMHRMAHALVDRGVAVWNVEYRGIDVPGGGYPGTFEDIAAGADMLGERGAEHGLDLGNVIAVGHSAGGHLALWLAARSKIGRGGRLWSQRPLVLRGAVTIGGLPDLEQARTQAADACGVDTVDRLVGPATPERPNPYHDTSPTALLPLGTPQLLICGEADTISPPLFTASYAAKARTSGDDVSTMTIAGQGHFELITPGTPAGDTVIDAVLDLLAEPRS